MISYKQGSDVPIKMWNAVQSVVIGNQIYVGGGISGNAEDCCTVMKYDIAKNSWTILLHYGLTEFAMLCYFDKLALVGGCNSVTRKDSSRVAIFDTDQWVHPYPFLNIARHASSAVAFRTYMVIAGGWIKDQTERTSTVEVYSSIANTWYMATSLPTPKSTVLLHNSFYVIGGFDSTGCSRTVHRTDLTKLIERVESEEICNEPGEHLWKQMKATPLKLSAPVTSGASIIAVGGEEENGRKSTAVHLFCPNDSIPCLSTNWIKVGDMPTARGGSTCCELSTNKLFVVGGFGCTRVDFISIHP